MKNILKYSALAVLVFLVSGLTGCTPEGLETDQFSGFSLAAIAPNPVMRGGVLRLVGSNLENVKEVKFAGDVTVTDIEVVEKGQHSEIRVTVPLVGPEIGKVTVVNADGVARSTRFDLTFTEPISIDSFSPATVLSGDVLTVKGEYLNNVKEVIFADGIYITEFVSQSRNELKVAVPANAVTGFVILGDVNELEDDKTIPNQIYSAKELIVGKPTVEKAAKATYKSGDVITVKGAHLDMIEAVNLTGAAGVDFTVAADNKSLSFNLPLSASDGNITLVSYAGDSFDAGEIETVTVTGLAVASLAADGRYKAGTSVSITGDDLDLVETVEFTGAEAQWYLDGKKIVATVPSAAQDGIVTVTLGSGKKAYSEEIEVVKPVVTACEYPEDGAVAGESVVVVNGDDLDLVTGITIGDKDHTLIPCEYTFKTLEGGAYAIEVNVPANAYTGPLTLTADSGYSSSTEEIPVVYNEAVSIAFDEPSYGLGRNITISGKNLLKIEQIYIKGKKVVNYALRGDDAMSFGIPDKVGPGVYRLDLVLVDGTEMTWPVPFEITAPYTETFIWQGNHDLAGWGANLEAGPEDGFVQAGLQVGDLVRVYYNTYNDWWQFKLQAGHWDPINLEVLGGENTVSADNAASGNTFFSFEVTEDIYNQLTLTGQGWGYSFVINGEGAYITGISMIHFGAAEKRTTIWEGSVTVGDWDNSMSALSWGGYDWSTVAEGTKLAVSFTPSSDNAVMRFGNGSWVSLPSLAGLAQDGNIPIAGLSSYEFELTQADLDQLVNNGGLVICGAYFTITQVGLK